MWRRSCGNMRKADIHKSLLTLHPTPCRSEVGDLYICTPNIDQGFERAGFRVYLRAAIRGLGPRCVVASRSPKNSSPDFSEHGCNPRFEVVRTPRNPSQMFAKICEAGGILG